MRKFALALGLTLPALVACAGHQAITTVQSDVNAAEVALTAAERVALIYTSLPRCPSSAVCSDETTVAKIKAADNKAYAAVKAARDNVGTVALALSAINDFKALVPATANTPAIVQ